MNYENKFYEILENLFIGKEIQGKSGIANIMRIKSEFFFKLKDELKALTSPMEATFKEEIYNKLYGFFHRYFSDCGSIYFSYTPLFYDIYSKEYEGKKSSNYEKIRDAQNDVSLFYKTKMLYYIKSDVVLNDLEIKIENINFIFSTKNLNTKAANEKRKIIYILKKIEENSLFFDVVDSKESLLDEVSDIKSILKEAISSHKIKENISEELIKKAILTFESQSKIDFFINKNAKAFLEEQLDLYIYQYLFKQELELNLERFNQIQFIKKLALIIINFISQFENELSKIWNKKRFVLKSNIIVSLLELKEAGFDIEKLKECKKYKNQKQEWEDLGLLDSSFSLIEDLYLQIDTKYFEELKDEIEERIINFRKNGGLKNIDFNLDSRPLDSNIDFKLDSKNEKEILDFDGLFIKAENYEALNSLLPRFENKIKVIYIDPPYNTGGDDFMYIDKFKSSSYLSFMANRLELAREFLSDDGVIFISIDDREMAYLKVLMDEIFGEENFVNCLVWQKKKGGSQDAQYFAKEHEYILCYQKGKWEIQDIEIEQEEKDFIKTINGRKAKILKLEKWGSNSLRINSPTMYYPIKDPNGEDFYPIAPNGEEGCWRKKPENLDKNHIFWQVNQKGRLTPYEVIYFDEVKNTNKTIKTRTIFTDYGTNVEATKELQSLFNDKTFSYPKPVSLIKHLIKISTPPPPRSDEEILVLDFFAGSGTSAHAVMELNKEDNGRRKIILIEQGEYFSSCIIPRIKKINYASKWKDGKYNEESINTRFNAFKYYEFESYEDILSRVKYAPLDKDYLEFKEAKNINDCYVFDKKLGFCFENFKLDLELLYPQIDLKESILNITGESVKEIKNGFCIFENKKIKKRPLVEILKEYLIW